MERNIKYPLVSVVVITYNSSELVTETLDSIYNQTYKNIELIVSDDCSQDNTIENVREWVTDHSGRFVDIQLVISNNNTGTSANCNRGIRACHGDWIRIIAGDDLMPENSISSQIDFVISNRDVKIINGYSSNFIEKDKIQVEIPSKKKAEINPRFYIETADYQYNYLLRHTNFGLTEGTMVSRWVYDNVCMYDEKYTIIEDLPFWLNVTKAGIKYYYIDVPTLLYRIHESVVHSENGAIFKKKFVDIKRQIVEDMIKPNIAWYNIRIKERFLIDDFIYWLVFSVFCNRKSFISRIILFLLYKIRL